MPEKRVNQSVSHESFIKTIRKYETKIEQRFGVIRFEIGKPSEGSLGGRPEKYALLTESQATTIMTFSRNTDQVVECKLNLVTAFERAKSVIKTVIPQQSARIQELELELSLAKEINASKRLDSDMLTMHGKETVLALRGMSDQVVKSEVLVTERLFNKRHFHGNRDNMDQMEQETIELFERMAERKSKLHPNATPDELVEMALASFE